MGFTSKDVLMLMLVSAAVRVGSCGNFGADQCSISSDCLQCVSSETPEVERCFQLRLLILGSVSISVYRSKSRLEQPWCPPHFLSHNFYCSSTCNGHFGHISWPPMHAVEDISMQMGFPTFKMMCNNSENEALKLA